MKTLILLALLGFVLALSLAIPFNGDTAEAYDAESTILRGTSKQTKTKGKKDT